MWVLEGDSGSWKGRILGPGRVRFWGLVGGGFWGLEGSGFGPAWFWVLEVDLWALEGSGFGAWKGIVGPGRGLWVMEGSGFEAW